MVKIGLLTKTLKGYLNKSAVQSLTNIRIYSFIDESSNVTKRLWSFIKRMKQNCIGIGPLEYQNASYTNPLSKVNVLAEYFSSVFTSENTSNISFLEGDPFPKISPIQINADGVAQLLLNLRLIRQLAQIIFHHTFSKKLPIKLPQLFL